MNSFKSFIHERRNAIFSSNELSALEKTEQFSKEIDKLLIDAYTNNIEKSGLNKHICMIAIGGYGRNELCPYSDIDLFILHSGEANKDAIATTIRFFWDMGLNLGVVVRSFYECSKMLGEDISSDTALLSSRFLAGNQRLFMHWKKSIIRPYFERTKKQFIASLRKTIHDGIFASDNTLYRTEPDLKNGICTLRDCQRILWAESVALGTANLKELGTVSHYNKKDVDALLSAYEFLTNLRITLHMFSQKRIDVLEIAVQPDIAKKLGFGAENPALLMESYFHTVRSIKYFCMLFLEKRLPSRSLWNVFRSELGALQPKTGIRLLDGILFIVHDKLDKKTINAAWILDIFRLCGVYQATLGVEMANFIRTTMDFLTVEDFRSKEVDSLFLDILSQEKDSGRLLILMHDCNVLAGVIPAFKAITCKVEYDSNHEYTIDQHILLALSALDNLKKDEDECIRTTFDFCKDKRLLRIAILLHDIGKGMPGDHVTNGSIIAEEMCDRLGLLEQEKRRVVFLVYNHLALSDLAFSRELEDHLVFDFAKKVGDADLLSMLYLLTVLDIRHVGYRTWTSWRAQLLMNAYEKIAACLQPAAIGNAGANSVSVGIDSELYTLDTLEEDRAKHHLWLSELKEQDFRIEYDSLIGFDRLTVLSTDRMGFFADITGCISSEGYNILSARAYSTYDGKILDVFNVEPDGITSLPSQERIVNIKKKWEQIRLNTATAEKMLQDRLRMYPPKKNRGTAITPSVKLDNNTSQLFTVLEIEAQDHFGLLYRITRVLSNHNINIVSARLSTRIDRAVDVFYLTDNSGQKLLDGSVFTAISSDLKDSLV